MTQTLAVETETASDIVPAGSSPTRGVYVNTETESAITADAIFGSKEYRPVVPMYPGKGNDNIGKRKAEER